MMMGVMNEFGEGKHGRPRGLVVGTKYAEVDFEFLINSFSLSVGLRVKSGGKGVLVS